MSGEAAAMRAGMRRVARVAAAMADRARAAVPRDVRVEALVDGIAVTGRRLRERALTDARLRDIGR